MMELRFVVAIDVPDRGGRRASAKAARDVMLKLAAELIQCSVAIDDAPPKVEVVQPARGNTTKAR